VSSAARTNIRFGGAEVEVCAPGIDGLTTTEGNDYKFVGVIDGDKTGDISRGLLSGLC
jgi:hypothetical protein